HSRARTPPPLPAWQMGPYGPTPPSSPSQARRPRPPATGLPGPHGCSTVCEWGRTAPLRLSYLSVRPYGPTPLAPPSPPPPPRPPPPGPRALGAARPRGPPPDEADCCADPGRRRPLFYPGVLDPRRAVHHQEGAGRRAPPAEVRPRRSRRRPPAPGAGGTDC